MKCPKYTQPDNCQAGCRYYLKSKHDGRGSQFSEVVFIGYRPHPGEIVVDDGMGPRVVHRLCLYQKNDPASS
jgi:hypothetical protein